MSKKTKSKKTTKTLRITSDLFTVTYGEGEGLQVCMRLDYNIVNGIHLFVSKEKGVWEVHSNPFPGQLPKKELNDFIGLFKRSIRRFNPKARFQRTLIST